MHLALKNMCMLFVMLALVTIAIALFFVRENFVPENLGYELNIGAKKSEALISEDQFLIQIRPTHASKLSSILDPLDLELEMPLLNWLLVKKKNQLEHRMVPLNSSEARIARQTLSSLLAHPLVVDAHHNYFMQNTMSLGAGHFFGAGMNDQLKSLNLAGAYAITRGNPRVAIGVVDQFSLEGRFNFASAFSRCLKRVGYFSANNNLPSTMSSRFFPHGDIMLQALGACGDQASENLGIENETLLFVAEPSFEGHAEHFLAALGLSGIDVCRHSLLPCPKPLDFDLPPQKIDILLLPFGNDAPELLQISTDIIHAINKQNIIVVSGAGNNRSPSNNFFPGGAPGLINVASLNQHHERAKFSNWGPTVDIMAPGDKIAFVYANGQKFISGTSISAAFTTLAIAFIKSIKPELNYKTAEHILRESAAEIPCDHYCNKAATKEACTKQCCPNLGKRCGALSLDIAKALHYANDMENTPLIRIDHPYLLYMRDEEKPKETLVSNIGDAGAQIEIASFEPDIEISPQKFFLAPRSSQGLKLFFKREPFTRKTFKFTARALVNGVLKDHSEFFLEYVPKK